MVLVNCFKLFVEIFKYSSNPDSNDIHGITDQISKQFEKEDKGIIYIELHLIK